MPTLQQRKDGCFFIRHFYSDHSTWQILGDGVRYLERRGIKEENRFSTDLFMELWMLGLVYHGDVPPGRPAVVLRDTAVSAEVRSSVREFHKAIFSGGADYAWRFVLQSAQGAMTFEQFRKEVIGEGRYRLISWNIKDIIIYNLPADIQPAFEGAKGLAAVTIEIGLADSLSGQRDAREETRYWLELNDKWLVLWRGFDT